MPYPYDNRGLLGRVPQGGPWALGDDMAAPTGQRWNPSTPYLGMPQPKPKPKPAASPQKPAMTQQQQYEAAMGGYGAMKGAAAQPQQQYNDAMAGYGAMKTPPPDPGMTAYGMPQQPAGAAPQQPMQYDAAMGAYPDQPQVQRQPQPGEQATGDNAQQGKLFGYDPQDWMSMGLAIMAGGANGGDWSMASQAMQGIQGRQREDKRIAVEDKRYDAQMQRQAAQDAQNAQLHGYNIQTAEADVAERARVAQVRKDTTIAAEQMLKERPLDADTGVRSLLSFATKNPDAFQGVLEYNIGLAKESRDEAREIKLIGIRGAMEERVASARAATDQAGASSQLQKQMSGIDQRELAPLVTQAMQINTRALPALDSLLNTLYEAKARGLESGAMAPGVDIKLKSMFDSQDRNLFDKWKGGSTLAAINALKGLGPMAAQELEATANALGSPEISVDAAISQIEGVIAQNKNWSAEVLRRQQFFNEAGGMSGPGVKNRLGESFLESEQRYLQENNAAPFSGTSTMSSSPAFKSLVEDVSKPGANRDAIYQELLKSYAPAQARLIMAEAQNTAARTSGAKKPAQKPLGFIR